MSPSGSPMSTAGGYTGRAHVGQRARRRENAIMLSENASSDERTPSCRRTTRLPTRKRHLLDGERGLRREKAIFSPTVRQGEKITPSILHFKKLDSMNRKRSSIVRC